MKVFVADNVERGFKNESDYNWCTPGEILIFSHFTLGNVNPSAVSMNGINSWKYTTHIVVKDMNIPKSFYKELLIEYVEKVFKCRVNKNGDYTIEIGFGLDFNINKLLEELIEKANKFEDGDKVISRGRKILKIEQDEECVNI